MNPDRLDIRLIDPEQDLPGVCQLFQTVFGQPMPEAHWRWKYAQAPALAHVNVVAADPGNGQSYGHAGAVVFAGSQAGQPLRMAHATDVMVHPSMRSGLGPDNLYRRLMQALRSALAAGPPGSPLYAYGFPGVRPSSLGERLGLYRRLYRVSQTDGATAPSRARDRWLPGLWRIQAELQPPHRWDAALLDSLSVRDRCTAGTGPVLHKTAAYLDWRYRQHPAHRYQLWLLRRRKQPAEGWLITRQDGVPTLIDACLPASRHGRGAADALAALARASGIDGWVTWLELPGAERQATPIVAVEFLGDAGFHPDWPAPAFQPGDTDVY